MIETIEKDILDLPKEHAVLLIQCNALGYGATGLMKRLREEHNEVFEEYHKYCGWFKDRKHQEEVIGHLVAWQFKKSTNRACFAYAQRFFTDTKYEFVPEAWKTILKNINRLTIDQHKSTGIMHEIHCPYKIGNGMKPEEVAIAREIVDEVFRDSPVKFVYHI